jgi:hypothetical protein
MFKPSTDKHNVASRRIRRAIKWYDEERGNRKLGQRAYRLAALIQRQYGIHNANPSRNQQA